MTDGRVAVVLGGAAGPGDAVLGDADLAGEHGAGEHGIVGHGVGCACCGGRSAAGAALNRLFQRRARGEAAWFRRVVVQGSAATEQAVLAALEEDVVARARFCLGPYTSSS